MLAFFLLLRFLSLVFVTVVAVVGGVVVGCSLMSLVGLCGVICLLPALPFPAFVCLCHYTMDIAQALAPLADCVETGSWDVDV